MLNRENHSKVTPIDHGLVVLVIGSLGLVIALLLSNLTWIQYWDFQIYEWILGMGLADQRTTLVPMYMDFLILVCICYFKPWGMLIASRVWSSFLWGLSFDLLMIGAVIASLSVGIWLPPIVPCLAGCWIILCVMIYRIYEKRLITESILVEII